MLFFGEYLVNFSGNNRIIIPKKIREALGNKKTFTLTKSFDQCLSGFRNEDWEKSVIQFMGDNVLSMENSHIKRHLFSSAVVLEIDEQGRVVIPKNLIDYANLKDESVYVIGVGTYFEIWDKNKWEQYSKEIPKNIKSIKS
jgi:MraZ protein